MLKFFENQGLKFLFLFQIFRSYEELNRTLGCTMVKTSLTTHSNRHRISSGSSRVQMRGSNQFKNKREKSSSSNLNESTTEPSAAETSVPLEETQQPQSSRSQEVVKTETEVKPEVVVESPGKKEKSPKPIKKPGKRGGISAGSDRGTVSLKNLKKSFFLIFSFTFKSDLIAVCTY